MSSSNGRTPPPGTVKSLSAEQRWKEYRPDGGFGGQSGGVQDDETRAKEGANGANKTPKATKAKVGASGLQTTNTLTVGGSTTVGASGASTVLPESDPKTGNASLALEAGNVAGTLPITDRVAVVAASKDATASATDLSRAVDKLSDDLSSGVTDPVTLAQDVANYQTAMVAAGHGDDAAQGLKTVIATSQMTETTAINAVAKAAGLDLAGVAAVTLEQAQAKLTADLADSAVDAGIIDLDVEQVKNLTASDDGTQTASDILDAAVGSSGGDYNNLAALYAAAAKNGVDLSKDSHDKIDTAKNKGAQAALDKATKKNLADEAAASQAQQQQSYNAGGSGGGGGNTSTNASSQAPTYDPKAAATPYGAKENLSNWKQQTYDKGAFNNEQERYTNNGQNISYGADGSATITAKNEGNGNWSSARITGDPVGSLPKYLEATISNPSGQGTWPAFWLVGPGAWPQGGEVDVMEQVNGDSTLHTSNHWGSGSVGSAGEMPAWSPTESFSGIDMTQPHRYGVMVTDSGTQFYLDGKKIGAPVTYPPESNFAQIAQQMVPTINLAMGGSWPGGVPNDLGDQTMKVYSMTRSTTAPDDSGTSDTKTSS